MLVRPCRAAKINQSHLCVVSGKQGGFSHVIRDTREKKRRACGWVSGRALTSGCAGRPEPFSNGIVKSTFSGFKSVCVNCMLCMCASALKQSAAMHAI